jgi:integrase
MCACSKPELDSGRFEREELKSQKERRIHLGGQLLEVLQRRWKHQLAQRLQAGQGWRGADYQASTPIGYIFTTTLGTPIEVDTISKYFLAVRQRAGLDIDRFHGLRRAFTTLLDQAGVSDRVAMEMAGHKDVSMTHYYNTPIESAKRDAAMALDGVLRRPVSGGEA